jgi:hypothetical protein
MRRGVGSERQAVWRGSFVQAVENTSGLDAGDPRMRIDLDHMMKVPGKVDAHGDVARLSG